MIGRITPLTMNNDDLVGNSVGNLVGNPVGNPLRIVKAVFNECRGQNGTPTAWVPVYGDDVPEVAVLQAVVQSMIEGARGEHPGLGDDLDWRDFKLTPMDVKPDDVLWPGEERYVLEHK